VQHFPGILTRLINKTLSYGQKPWKGSLHDLIEVSSIFPRFEAEDATNSQKAL
jgi:hypothetical protein